MKISIEEHRSETLADICTLLQNYDRVACVRPTGYGKTILIKSIADTVKGTKVVIVPKNILKEYIEYFFVGQEDLKVVTYQKIANLRSKKDVLKLFGGGLSAVFLDEMHRSGAETWNTGVELVLSTYFNVKLIGMTATPLRADGINVVSSVFGGVQVKPLSILDAIILGFYPEPTYVTSLYTLEDELRVYLSELEKKNGITDDKKAIITRDLKSRLFELAELRNIPSILSRHITSLQDIESVMKFLVFCVSVDFLINMRETLVLWFSTAFPAHRINLYFIHHGMSPKDISDTIENFKLNKVAKSIDLLLSVDMLNEGVHFDDLTGALFLRRTKSDLLYFQQVGRVLLMGASKRPIIFDFVNNHRAIEGSYPSLVNSLLDKVNSKLSFEQSIAVPVEGEEVNVSVEGSIVLNSLLDLSEEVNDFDNGSFSDFGYASFMGDAEKKARLETLKVNIFDEVEEVHSILKKEYISQTSPIFSEIREGIIKDRRINFMNIADLVDKYNVTYKIVSSILEEEGLHDYLISVTTDEIELSIVNALGSGMTARAVERELGYTYDVILRVARTHNIKLLAHRGEWGRIEEIIEEIARGETTPTAASKKYHLDKRRLTQMLRDRGIKYTSEIPSSLHNLTLDDILSIFRAELSYSGVARKLGISNDQLYRYLSLRGFTDACKENLERYKKESAEYIETEVLKNINNGKTNKEIVDLLGLNYNGFRIVTGIRKKYNKVKHRQLNDSENTRIMHLISEGKTYPEVCEEIYISRHTYYDRKKILETGHGYSARKS